MDKRKPDKPAGGTAPLTVEEIAGDPPVAPTQERKPTGGKEGGDPPAR